MLPHKADTVDCVGKYHAQFVGHQTKGCTVLSPSVLLGHLYYTYTRVVVIASASLCALGPESVSHIGRVFLFLVVGQEPFPAAFYRHTRCTGKLSAHYISFQLVFQTLASGLFVVGFRSRFSNVVK